MDGVIRYRLRFRQRLMYVAFTIVPVRQTLNPDNPVRPLSAATLVLWVGLLALVWRRFGVELQPDALVLYGLRRRVYPWSRIDRVERSKSFGTTCLKVSVDGRRRTLRAPQHTPFLSPDDEFDAKAATIVRTWEARRRPDWLVSA